MRTCSYVLMSRTRRRRCCICRVLFRPDPRVGDRQKTCGSPACQRARATQRQAIWRQRNPDYFTDRRLRQRHQQAELATAERPLVRPVVGSPSPVRAPPAPQLPDPWRRIPWDLVQAELGVLTADVLALVIRLLAAHFWARDGAVGMDSS